MSFQQKRKSISIITVTIRGYSRKKLYQELGLETLQPWRCYRKFCFFFKILKLNFSNYLYQIIPVIENKVTQENTTLFFFKNTCFSSVITEWNKLDWKIKNSESTETLTKIILSIIKPSPNSTFSWHNPEGINLLSRLGLRLTHLRENKFKKSFQDSLNPSAVVGKVKLKLVLIAFPTVPMIRKNDWPSWTL